MTSRFKKSPPILYEPQCTVVDNEFLLKRFKMKREQLARLGRDTKPLLVFHGTDTTIAMTIAKEGFKIPQIHGGSCRVKHGSAYGVGVYVSPNASMAYGYQGGSIIVSVCVLGHSTPDEIRQESFLRSKYSTYDYDSYLAHNICVIHDVDSILPLYIFTFY